MAAAMSLGAIECVCRARNWRPFGEIERPAGQAETLGCEEDAAEVVFDIDGRKFYRCPATYVGPQERALLAAYVRMKQGWLPVDGGWLDQSATFMDAMDLIAATVAENEKE